MASIGGGGGRGVKVVEMMQRRSLEVLCVQETRRKGDRARKLVGGYMLLHAGGDGRRNGMEIIISEEVSKQVIRVERWKGRIIMAWVVILRQMAYVMSVYGPQMGSTGAEKQEFRDAWRG